MRRSAALLLAALALTACREEGLTPPPQAPVLTPALGTNASGPERYIVVFKAGIGDVDGAIDQLSRTHGLSPVWRYRTAIKGFAASVPAAALAGLRQNPNVSYVIADEEVTLAAAGSQALTSSQWGLDRIDQAGATRNNTYTWDVDGTGVEAYILDTGIRYTHTEFGGRALSFYDYVDNDPDAQECHGHGTHVAGTVGGTTVGVAKNVTLYSARVLGCSGSGSYSGVIAAIDAITARKAANPTIPMVGNMSLGSTGQYLPVITAVNNSVAAGVVWAIAAGNSNMNACDYSPAASLNALTVGASASGDFRASFSNWGTCVDVFAPGSSIYSATKDGDATYASWAGTSMAAPHVAGVAALYLSAYPAASAYEVNAAVTGRAVPNLLRTSDLGSGSPNLLLQSRITGTQASGPAAGTYPLTVALIGNTTGTVSATGIACSVVSGADCEEFFAAGTSVTLTATPGANTSVTWSGACTGSALTCTVSMTAYKQVTASFNVPRLSVSRSGSGLGTVTSTDGTIGCGTGGSCTADYALNTTITLNASVPAGSSFTGWSGCTSASGTTCTVSLTATGTRTVTANYVALWTLTVATAGGGSGSVTSSPAGISCGADCTEVFSNGTSVTLTPTAATGSVFSGWSGACTGTGACTVSMTTARSVTATFTATTTVDLTVTRSGAGTGTVTSNPAGINCGTTCTSPFGLNGTVILTATPATGSTFGGWTGACTNATGTCTVTMSEAKSVEAVFNVATYALTVTKAGLGTGVVTSSVGGLDCGTTCTVQIAHGTSVSVTATADAGSVFGAWSGSCVGTGRTCSFTMTGARSMTATFNPAYTLTVTKTGTGTVTSSPVGISCGSDCSEPYGSGTSVTLTATAGTGYSFSGWSGACTNTSGTCTVTMDQAKSVEAAFTAITYDLTVALAGTGTGTVTSTDGGIACGVDCSQGYAYNTSVTLTATPDAGHSFTGWSGACSGTGSTCTVSMTLARSVTASFAPAVANTIHLAGLTGSKTLGSRNWTAGATALVHDQANGAASGVTVSFSWTGASRGSGSCVTGASGTCTVTKSGLKNTASSITFTVTGLSRSGSTVTAAAVSTSVTVTR